MSIWILLPPQEPKWRFPQMYAMTELELRSNGLEPGQMKKVLGNHDKSSPIS